MTAVPLVSCIMPTANRRRFVPESIRLFLAQDYAARELIVLDDGADAVADLIPDDPRIRYLRRNRREAVGVKRNLLCAEARGELVAHWDDDDWYAPWRLSAQVAALAADEVALCGLDRVLFFEPATRRAWEYAYPGSGASWVYGATFCYRKSLWRQRPFPEIAVGEDTQFAANVPDGQLAAMAAPGMYVGLVHRENTGPKRTRDPIWRQLPVECVAETVGADWLHAPREAAAAAATSVLPASPAAVAKPPARVCVGIYVHSDPALLAETLAHLRANTAAPLDILLLGDGPDLETRMALAGYTGLRQSTTDEPRGAAACFNRLLRESDAELLVFLESGSLVGPGWLDLIKAALASDVANGLAGPSTNLAWGRQGTVREARAGAANVAEVAARLRSRFGEAWQSLEPLYCLADFCYAVRRSVADAVGAADEAYGLGPCWEMDYTVRAVRAGFRAVWAQGAYVFRHPFSARRARDEARLFETNRRLYQDRFCGLKLTGARPGYARHCRGETCVHFAPADRVRLAIPLATDGPPPRLPARPVEATPAAAALEVPPLISCIMPTRDRREWVRQSIRYFERQDYPARELVIIDDGDDDLAAILPADPRIRHIRVTRPISIGAKRNLGCEAARGAVIAHWDDDDWYAPGRLSAQAAPLLGGAAEISALADTLFFDLAPWRFWRCSRQTYARMFVQGVHGGTLMFKRTVFDGFSRYPDLSLAEDALFLQAAARRGARLARVEGGELFAYVRHGGNAWRFACGEAYGVAGWRRTGEPEGFAAERAFYARQQSQSAAGDRLPEAPVLTLPLSAAEARHV